MNNDTIASRYIMRSFKFMYILLNTSVFTFIIYFCCFRMGKFFSGSFSLREISYYTVVLTMAYLIILLLVTRLYNAFSVGYTSSENLIYCQILSFIISVSFSYIMFVGLTLSFQNPLPFIIICGAELFISIIWSFTATKIYYKINKPQRTVLLYANSDDYKRISEAKQFPAKFNIVKEVNVKKEDTDSVLSQISDAEVVFLSGVDALFQNKIVTYCVDHNIHCYLSPLVANVIISGGKHNQSFSTPIVGVMRSSPNLEYLLVKRVFDILVSLVGIILTSPIMIITAIIIKLYDRGPILYKQVRLTKDGKKFMIYKFRSMRVDAEKDGIARLSTNNDDRITPIGKIIRACRIDELPQFFTILKGDMTLVGPRPERPEIAEQYLKDIPEFNLRLQVKAGLTGYAQVYGRYNTNPYDKLEMDLMYINKMSVFTDLKIMLYTARILFMSESTEGIDEGQTLASSAANDDFNIQAVSETKVKR